MVTSTPPDDRFSPLPLPMDSPEITVTHELAKKQPTLKSIVEAFRAAVKAQHRFEDPALRYVRSLDSEQSQRQALHALTWWLANYPWDASPDEMTNYWSQLNADSINAVRSASLVGDPDTGKGKLAAATINQRLSIIKGIAREAATAQLISRDTLDEILRIKRVKIHDQRATRTSVTKGDTQRLFESLEAEIERSDDELVIRERLRDLALVGVLIGSAARRGEIAGMRFGDLRVDNPKERHILVTGKGNKRGRAPLPSSPWQLLERWLRHIQESRLTDGLPSPSADDPLFPKLTRGKRILYSEPMSVNAIYERAKYLLDAYLGKKGSPHAFRRGKLTSTIDQHGVEVAKAIARHADISTTLGYDMREIDRMHKAVEESDL